MPFFLGSSNSFIISSQHCSAEESFCLSKSPKSSSSESDSTLPNANANGLCADRPNRLADGETPVFFIGLSVVLGRPFGAGKVAFLSTFFSVFVSVARLFRFALPGNILSGDFLISLGFSAGFLLDCWIESENRKLCLSGSLFGAVLMLISIGVGGFGGELGHVEIEGAPKIASNFCSALKPVFATLDEWSSSDELLRSCLAQNLQSVNRKINAVPKDISQNKNELM